MTNDQYAAKVKAYRKLDAYAAQFALRLLRGELKDEGVVTCKTPADAQELLRRIVFWLNWLTHD